MDGKINVGGKLELNRLGKWELALCPYATSGSQVVHCGTWCVKFQEPEYFDVESQTKKDGETDWTKSMHRTTNIEICGKQTLRFWEFTDERQMKA